MTDSIGLTAGLRQVEPETIEKSLDAAWREANAAALAGGGQAGARSSVMTLVAYSGDADEATTTLRVIEGLTTQHPSRSIVVAPTAGNPSGRQLEAFINTQAISSSGSTRYGEEIVLCATPTAMRHLAGSILPLIVSGLPAFLWWQGTPPWNTEVFEATIDGFDRLLVDTSAMPIAEHALLSLDELIRRKKTSLAISDFNFTRLGPWRELTAQFFDPTDVREYLTHVDRVTIEYAAEVEDSAGSAAQSYLFAGWLASRLGWRSAGVGSAQLMDGQRQHTMIDGSGHKVEVEINARYGVPIRSWMEIARGGESGRGPGAIGPGALMSVYIRAQSKGTTVSFTAAREADLMHASTHCQLPAGAAASPSQTVYLPSLGEFASLSDDLMRLGHDSLFEEALSAIAPMLDPTLRRARR